MDVGTRPRGMTVLALVVLSPAACAPSGGQDSGLPAATEEALLPLAIHARVAAGDVPDFGLLPPDGPILVLLPEDLRGSVELGSVGGRELVSVAIEDLRRRAATRSEPVHFLSVGRPYRDGENWIIRMGVDYESPEGDEAFKLCCCSGSAVFAPEGGGFRFSRWEMVICS